MEGQQIDATFVDVGGGWKMTRNVHSFLPKLRSLSPGTEEDRGLCLIAQREKYASRPVLPIAVLSLTKGVVALMFTLP